MSKPDWVPVRDESEVYPGTALLRVDIGEVAIVTKRVVTDGNDPCSPDRSHCPSRLRWHDTESGEADGFEPYCLWEFIQRGVVYRLANLDDATADNETRARETAGGRER